MIDKDRKVCCYSNCLSRDTLAWIVVLEGFVMDMVVCDEHREIFRKIFGK